MDWVWERLVEKSSSTFWWHADFLQYYCCVAIPLVQSALRHTHFQAIDTVIRWSTSLRHWLPVVFHRRVRRYLWTLPLLSRWTLQDAVPWKRCISHFACFISRRPLWISLLFCLLVPLAQIASMNMVLTIPTTIIRATEETTLSIFSCPVAPVRNEPPSPSQSLSVTFHEQERVEDDSVPTNLHTALQVPVHQPAGQFDECASQFFLPNLVNKTTKVNKVTSFIPSQFFLLLARLFRV